MIIATLQSAAGHLQNEQLQQMLACLVYMLGMKIGKG